GAIATGGSAAIGMGLALSIGQHEATTRLARNLSAGGNVTLEASAVSAVVADGQASAGGAPAETTEDTTVEDGKQGVDKKVAAQRTHLDKVAGDNQLGGSGSAEAPSAETSDGPISVAAAVGVAISTVHAGAIV